MMMVHYLGQSAYDELRRDYLNAVGVKSIEESLIAGKLILPKGLRDYLFSGDNIDSARLEELIAGPTDAPRSFGGNGIPTMREFFERIIKIAGNKATMTSSEYTFCKSVFDYERIVSRGKISGDKIAYRLMSRLGLRSCLYCNRLYTIHVHNIGRGKGVRPDFDHFYPKSLYPYLAVNLFNLLPSCSFCNKLKGEKAEKVFSNGEDYSILYPWEDSFDEAEHNTSFRVVPNEAEYRVMTGISDRFTVELQPTKALPDTEFAKPASCINTTALSERFELNPNASESEKAYWNRVKNTIELFGLEALYNEHKTEIQMLLRNHYQYSEIGIEMIRKTLIRGNNKTLSEEELAWSVRNMLYFGSLEHDNWGNSPLNKLKHDILQQLDEMEKYE